jgi:lysophospholipase L1-like esterase
MNLKLNTLKISFLLVSFLLMNSAFSQNTSWDSTFRPASYDVKVAQFKSYANSPGDIIFLGNSITANTDWSELLGIPNVKNRGISGDITFGVVERLKEVTEGKPAKVFILIGVNDISRNIPYEYMVQNYEKIISALKTASPATKIYIQTLLPTNNTYDKFKNHYNKDEKILAINQFIRELASKEKITLIDLYPHFLDGDKKLDKQYTIDGLHLSAAGYFKWKEILDKGGYLK